MVQVFLFSKGGEGLLFILIRCATTSFQSFPVSLPELVKKSFDLLGGYPTKRGKTCALLTWWAFYERELPGLHP